jgi:hypothetical protein
MLRFSIREVLLLMLIVGLACGWMVEHRRAHRLQSDLQSAQASLYETTTEIRRLHRVNEITADQWAKALGQLNSTRNVGK